MSSLFDGIHHGLKQVSPDLRLTEKKQRQRRSLYPVNAAIGISVSDAFLLGAQPVVVEGVSDQHHLTAMKGHLVASGALQPQRDLVFVPADGVRAVKAIASILAGPKEDLPFVVLDGDEEGRKLASNLKSKLYASAKERVITIDAITGREGDEIEDLWPTEFFADAASRLLRAADEDFRDVVSTDKPIVDQVEAFATGEGIELERPGWKVEAAKLLRVRLVKRPEGVAGSVANQWADLFGRLLGKAPA